ncbi:MAG: hypothetical protein HXS47_01675 [Theionarchaea archaeon]|nr:hypothetical protein [Theionarchaea archaeon]
MTLDDLKREFVEYMETAHGKRYHRNFFGCLAAILVEKGPVTQKRIMELTGYSKPSVSIALQKIQLTVPVRAVKLMGDRKHYYEYQGSPQEFLLDILQKRTDVPDIDVQMIHTMKKKVEKKRGEHSSYNRLWEYLTEFSLYLELMYTIRKNTLSTYRTMLFSDSFQEGSLPESPAPINILEHSINSLNLVSSQNNVAPDHVEEHPPLEYIALKREYFRGIRMGLNPLFPQSVAHLLIIVHDVLIEQGTTQEKIQESTQLPRSTISEVLAQAVEQGMVQVESPTGTRIKIYRPAYSLLEVVLNYYDRACTYASHTRRVLHALRQNMQHMTPQDAEFQAFYEVLHSLERAYTITQKITLQAKTKFIRGLHEYRH